MKLFIVLVARRLPRLGNYHYHGFYPLTTVVELGVLQELVVGVAADLKTDDSCGFIK